MTPNWVEWIFKYEPNWNYLQRDGGGLKQKTLHGRVVDIF